MALLIQSILNDPVKYQMATTLIDVFEDIAKERLNQAISDFNFNKRMCDTVLNGSWNRLVEFAGIRFRLDVCSIANQHYAEIARLSIIRDAIPDILSNKLLIAQLNMEITRCLSTMNSDLHDLLEAHGHVFNRDSTNRRLAGELLEARIGMKLNICYERVRSLSTVSTYKDTFANAFAQARANQS